mmetsp:Transcript_11808/g.13611  ORF Transcript_11808/g.13611 Transcript_11808/m.13611 type:complete len:89 (+) Transcript_11808:511-777(+)
MKQEDYLFVQQLLDYDQEGLWLNAGMSVQVIYCHLVMYWEKPFLSPVSIGRAEYEWTPQNPPIDFAGLWVLKGISTISNFGLTVSHRW